MGHAATTDVLAERARSFADAIADCTALLPDLVDAYGADAERYAGLVDRVDHLESRCDSLARDLRRLLGGGSTRRSARSTSSPTSSSPS
jgi:uncharacterized protein Yka (UPF0111/DUF47 family)